MCDKHPYTSCIKLHGVPIIPPLITPKISEECRRYKLQAIELERKLERNKLFEKCMEDLEKLKVPFAELKLEEPQMPVLCSLENELIFGQDRNETHVPYEQYKKLQNLTSETIDVTEYNKDGMKLIRSSTEKNIPPAPPKLIRSNSYTLDSPSPILLAHLRKQQERRNTPSTCSSESSSVNTEMEVKPDQSQNFLIETDVCIQQVSVSTPMTKEELSVKESSLNFEPKNAFIPPQLLEVLSKLPSSCSSKIMEVLGNQGKEQLGSIENHEELKSKALGESLDRFFDNISPDGKGLSISSSQSLYYSLSPSEATLTPVKMRSGSGCSKKLFGNLDLKREWAASVIGAAAKGYLVRRLIQTEKVQALIETIKDALLCAIQLHSAEIIDESDVELHRRLIQQISAGCYAFHDIFFKLSPKEKMSIISKDRRRKIEKARRPLSGTTSNISISTTPQSLRSVR